MKMRVLTCAWVAILALGSSAWAMDESKLAQSFEDVAIPYFETGRPGTMVAKDGVHIRYRVFPTQASVSKGSLVIVSGRTEFMRKYAELIYDLRETGYTIFIYDHRGQGESDRLTQDPLKGYVLHFSDYVSDLTQFMNQVVLPSSDGKTYILSHSMGGAVVTHYLIQNPGKVAAYAAVSPMYEANLGSYSQAVALTVLNGLILIGKGEDYAQGRSADEVHEPFEGNQVTTSRARYANEDRELTLHPELAIAGPTNRWVRESIVSSYWLKATIGWLKTPTVVLQASNETVVNPKTEEQLCARAKDCRLVTLPNSKHELLMEQDAIRNKTIRAALSLFAKH